MYLVSTMAMAELVGDVSAPMTAHVSTPGTDSMSTQGADTDVRPDDEGVRPSESPGTDIMRAEAMAAYTRSLLEPLVAHVAELEGTVRAQAETIGELRAQNHALLARTETQSVEPTTGAPTARSSSTMWLTPRRFWLIAVLVLVLIGVGVVQVTVALYSLAVQLAMPG